MSGYAFTPGPWRLTETFVKGQWGNSDRWICEITCPDDRLIVAEIPEYKSYPEEEAEVVANARLIAAAPDLLESLIDARKQLEDYERSLSGEGYNSPSINAAIAKAITAEQAGVEK